MKYPSKRFLTLTWVGWLNFLLLQWACVRLQAETDDDRNVILWQIRIALPLTGWWSEYIPDRNWYWPRGIRFEPINNR